MHPLIPRAGSRGTSPDHAPTSRFVLVLTFFAAIGGFLFGYDTGVISGAMLLLAEDFSLSPTQQEAVVSATVAAAMAGAACGGFANQRFGRRWVIIASAAVFTAGAAVMGFAGGFGVMVLGRAAVGLAIGLTSMTVPMYISEAAPPRARGMLVAVNIVFVTGGQAIAGAVDGLLSAVPEGWRYMLGLSAVPAVIMGIGFLFLPESPRWLVSKGRLEEARHVLRAIRTPDDAGVPAPAAPASVAAAPAAGAAGTSEAERVGAEVEAELEEVSASLRRANGQVATLRDLVATAPLRRALLLGCVLQALQQLCAINTVMYYSATILTMAGVGSTRDAIWLAAAVAACNFVFTLVGMALADRLGRRRLTLWSLAGVALALLALGGVFVMQQHQSPQARPCPATPALPDAATLLPAPPALRAAADAPAHFAQCQRYATCAECVSDADCGFCLWPVAADGGGGAGARRQGSCVPGAAGGPASNSSAFGCPLLPTAGGYAWSFSSCPDTSGWPAVVALMLYLACFAPGLGTTPWTVNAEIYPLHVRALGSGAATAVNWTCNLLISMTFLDLVRLLSPQGAFWTYAAVAVAGWAFCFALMPETRGKSLEEVERAFAQGGCIGLAQEREEDRGSWLALDSGDGGAAGADGADHTQPLASAAYGATGAHA